MGVRSTASRIADPERFLARLCVTLVVAGAAAACSRTGAPVRTRTIRDGFGRTVTLPATPRRIVSLAPSVTDTLDLLGLGIRVVGISDFCAPPAGSVRPARVGGLVNPSLEAIRALSPDLLVASGSGNDPTLASQAEALALPLYTMHAADVPGVLAAVAALGDALGEAERGRQAARDLQGRLDRVAASVAGRRPPRVLFVVWGQPLVVPGQGAFLTDALARAGGVSITADAPGAWPSVALESAIARAPDVVLTVPQNRAWLDQVRRDPAWSGVPAVTSGRLIVVSEAIQQPGPRVVAGIEEVAPLLHPPAAAGTP